MSEGNFLNNENCRFAFASHFNSWTEKFNRQERISIYSVFSYAVTTNCHCKLYAVVGDSGGDFVENQDHHLESRETISNISSCRWLLRVAISSVP